MKKKSIAVIKTKLLITMTETKKPDRYKLLSKKRMIASPQTKIFSSGTLLIVQQPACARGLCKVRAHVHTCRPYAGCVYLCKPSKKSK